MQKYAELTATLILTCFVLFYNFVFSFKIVNCSFKMFIEVYFLVLPARSAILRR